MSSSPDFPAVPLDVLALAKSAILVPSGLDERDIERVLDSVMSHSIDSADLYFQLGLPDSAARMRRARIGALALRVLPKVTFSPAMFCSSIATCSSTWLRPAPRYRPS